MADRAQRTQYAYTLRDLSGDDFETEVITALTSDVLLGFQRISRSGGDGGLDGLSHQYTVAYCCYGLRIRRAPGVNTTQHGKDLKQKIVTKFCADINKLFELECRNKKLRNYVAKKNQTLEGILGAAPNPKIARITLCCNWTDKSSVLSELRDHIALCREVGSDRFVDKSANLVLWDPDDIAGQIQVSDSSIFRAQQSGLLTAITSALSEEPELEEATEEYESKFDDLLARKKSKAIQISQFRERYRVAWARSLYLENQVSASLPQMHRLLESARFAAAGDAQLDSLTESDPFSVIKSSRQKMTERLQDLVDGGLPNFICEQLAESEVARLIGECPLDWREVDDD